MQTYPECVPCILRATSDALDRAQAPRPWQWAILQEALQVCTAHDPSLPPVVLGGQVADAVRRALGSLDPYAQAKRQANKEALARYPWLKRKVEGAADPLLQALHLAAAGNSLDLGVYQDGQLEGVLQEALTLPLRSTCLPNFVRALQQARRVLYIADNAGEIVFDRVLIEELLARGKEVTLAVRGGPILNDATSEDVAQAGLDGLVPVVSAGDPLPGVVWERSSLEFQRAFAAADMVLAKGMGNFEGLTSVEGPVFFLFRAKCRPVSLEAGVALGDLVLLARRE